MSALGPRIEGDDTAVLRHALSLNPSGWALEFGVGGGGTLRLIAAQMPVLAFDSFDGLPENWRPGFEAGMFAQPRIPQIENATICVGWFDQTLPGFDWPQPGEVGLVHLDADLYSSTVTILDNIGHLLVPGVIVVMDEYHGFTDDVAGEVPGEQQAWLEWCLKHSAVVETIGHGREQYACRILGFGELVES